MKAEITTLFNTRLHFTTGAILFLLTLLFIFLAFLAIRRHVLKPGSRGKGAFQIIVAELAIALLVLHAIFNSNDAQFSITAGTFLDCFAAIVLFLILWDSPITPKPIFQTGTVKGKELLHELYPRDRFVWNLPSAVFFTSLLGGLFLLFKWDGLMPTSGGSIKFNSISGAGMEISYENKGHQESVSVVSVPAYRMATPTGIFLHPGDTVEISATGVASTSSTFDWFGGVGNQISATNFLSLTDVHDNIMRYLKETDFNRMADPDWRDPDGVRLYAANEEEFASNNVEAAAHVPYKLSANNNYGMLLGCVLKNVGQKANNLEIVNAVLEARTNNLLFPVGKGTTIQCQSLEGGRMRLHFPATDTETVPNDVPIDGVNAQLVLLINDVVVTKAMFKDFKNHLGFSAQEKENFGFIEDAVFDSTLAKEMDTNNQTFHVWLFSGCASSTKRESILSILLILSKDFSCISCILWSKIPSRP